ncbi:MAG: TIGR00282 family metallophosphoesterase [Candidatus Dormibacteria bacterium]
MSEIRLLFIGDVVGRPGRHAVRDLLPGLRRDHALDLVIANGENSAGGFGITGRTADELFAAGVDVITTGNHVYDQKEGWPELASYERVVRPANYPPGAPGHGWTTVPVEGKGTVSVLNLMGRMFMANLDCPFQAAEGLLARGELSRVLVVDLHAEATSEKGALGYLLDGRASLVVGTHTHVPTADARILPGGTAFCSDAGMVGPRESVIGVEPGGPIHAFLTGTPARFKVASGPVVFNSLLVTIDGLSGKASAISRLDLDLDGPAPGPGSHQSQQASR